MNVYCPISHQRSLRFRADLSVRRRLFGGAFLALILLSGCTNKSLELEVGNTSLSGFVVPFASEFSGLSSFSAPLCTTGRVSVHAVSDSGEIEENETAGVEMAADGSYKLPNAKSLGSSVSGLRYVIKAAGCGYEFYRPLTDTKDQHITDNSTLFVLSAKVSGAKALNDYTATEVKTVLDELDRVQAPTAGQSDLAGVVTNLIADTGAASLYQSVTSVSPPSLLEIPPSQITVTAPTSLVEGASTGYSVNVNHWNASYQAAYEWILDGNQVSTSDTWSYTTTKNSQGPHTLVLRVGLDDGAGEVDGSKPFESKTFSLSVANTFPAVAPSLSLASASPTNLTMGSVNIVTGASMVDCATFSKLAMTENPVLPPILATDFTIECQDPGVQTENFVVSTGDGTKTLALWARDAAGNVSAVASTTTAVLDQSDPTLGFTSVPSTVKGSTSANISWSATDALAGIDTVTLEYAEDGVTFVSEATLTGLTPPYVWSVPAGDHPGAKLKLLATDLAGNSTELMTSAIHIDSTAPTITQTSLTSPKHSNTNSVIFGGTCETGLAVNVSGAQTGTAACSSGSWTYTTNKSSDGSYAYTFAQTDGAGNSGSTSATWVRDIVPPTLTITGPAPGTSAQSGVTLQGTCEDGLDVVIAGSGALSTLTVACTAGSYSQFAFFSAGDGAKTLTVSQTDLAGNTSTQSLAVVRDRAAPALTQTAVTSPTSSNGDSMIFGGACEAGLTVTVSGTDTSTAACGAGTWTYTTATKTSDASRTYTFSQTDAAGNLGQVSATWIRDTADPVFTFTSASTFTTSGNSVNFQGACEVGTTTVVSGAETDSVACVAGVWLFTAEQTVDGTHNYTFTNSDGAGNSTVLNGLWTRNTAGPTITVTTTSPKATSGSSLLIEGTCTGGGVGSDGVIVVSGAESSTATCSSTDMTPGTWSFTANKASDGAHNYTFTVNDSFTPVQSSSVDFTWNRDTTQPTITSGSFTINGGTSSTTLLSYNPVDFSATDNLTKVTKVCVKTANSAPTSSDSCWYPLNGSQVGVTPANSVTVSGYDFNIGILPQAYDVYLWVMDGAGNISTNTALTGTDKAEITLSLLSAPTVSTVLVGKNDTMNGLLVERTIPGGGNVYIRWTAGGSSLQANPISIYFTTDDVNWDLVQSGLANGQNNCTSVTGSGSTTGAATGCYRWASGSPTSNYYRVRVAVTNTLNATTFANSLPVNAELFQVLAGNTEVGLNGSADSALFLPYYGSFSVSDAHSFVVSSNGTIYFRDHNLGVLSVDPSNRKMQLLIPKLGDVSGYGDGGSIANARLRYPSSLGIDPQDRLLIFDYDRIRRVDFSSSPPTIDTIIGGGSSASDTEPVAKNVQIHASTAPDNIRPLIVAPDGKIYFYSSTNRLRKVRIYNPATGAVTSLGHSGTTTDGAVAWDQVSSCYNRSPFLQFDKTTAELTTFALEMQSVSSTPGCTTPALTTSGAYILFRHYDVATGALDTGTVPTGHSTGMLPIQAYDGNIYVISRTLSKILKYNPVSATFTTIVGTGLVGNCPDGVAATSCAFDPGGGFVDSSGQLFFADRGKIKTLIGGNVVTLYGQDYGHGDGGLATDARISGAFSVQERSDGKLIFLESQTSRFRMLTRSGNIQTIAGNGDNANPSLVTKATSTSVMTLGNINYSNFALDSSDNLYYSTSRTYKLPNTYATDPNNTFWSQPVMMAASGAPLFYESAAHGQLSTAVRNTASYTRLIGFSGDTLLLWMNNSNNTNRTLAEVQVSGDEKYHILINVDTTVACAAGSLMSDCTGYNPSGANGYNIYGAYDSVTSRWMTLVGSNKTMQSFGHQRLGTTEFPTTLVNSAQAFVFRRFSGTSDRYVYYCALDGRMYLRNMDANSGAGAEVQLPWPIESASCSGVQFAYNEDNDSLIFTFKQNGMYGIGELFEVHPSKHGL